MAGPRAAMEARVRGGAGAGALLWDVRRYVVGLRQTVKTLAAKRCRMVLMAPNIEKICSEGV